MTTEHPPPEEWDKRTILLFLESFLDKVDAHERSEFEDIVAMGRKLVMGVKFGAVPVETARQVIRGIAIIHEDLTGESLL